jgi:hypothetical protein
MPRRGGFIDLSDHERQRLLRLGISCGVGGSNKIAASKAALYVQEEMRRSYELLNEDAVA